MKIIIIKKKKTKLYIYAHLNNECHTQGRNKQ